MKKLIVLLFVPLTQFAYAQSPGAQAMLKQIALLKVYINWLEKGYSIARTGLQTISDIKEGHWKLDIDFFDRLRLVNPLARSYKKVKAIIALQSAIDNYLNTLNKIQLNPGELIYVSSVTAGLKKEIEDNGGLLESILSDEQFQLSDDERINFIDNIYEDFLDKYEFISSFALQAEQLARQRIKEKRSIEKAKELYFKKP